MTPVIAHPIFVVIRNELRTLSREKTFVLLMGIFFAMTLFSVFIGWSTRTTTVAIYSATVAVLQSSGAMHIPPNPILGTSPLMVFSNLVIYILLVGALLSIVIGHRSFIRERKSGVIPLVFVRKVTKGQYVAGKLLGIGIALVAIIVAAFLVSATSAIFIPALNLSPGEFLRLLGLYVAAFLYLALFAALGFFFAARMKTESGALFAPIMLWVITVFVLPELATGQNPVALLNPITLAQAAPTPAAFFALLHPFIAPFSVGQLFTHSAFQFLTGGWQVGGALTGLALYLGVVCIASVYAVRSYSIASDSLL